MRIRELANKLGESFRTIKNIAAEWGHKVSPDTKLTEEEINIITKRLEKLNNQNLASFFGSLKNRFAKVNQLVKHQNYPVIKSHFSDDDAIDLCTRVYDSTTNQLAKQFRKNKSNEEYKYSIHRVAENMHEFYGGTLLTFVLSLKPIALSDPTTQMYVAETKNNATADFSLRDLIFTNENQEELTIVFKRKINLGYPGNFGFAVFRKKKNGTKEPVYAFSEGGNLIKSFIYKTPSITLFSSLIGGSTKFYFGQSSSNCLICDRELTDPVSIIYGIGPGCRANFPFFFK